jgi:selenocysteine lyase/cysteine desulfurase
MITRPERGMARYNEAMQDLIDSEFPDAGIIQLNHAGVGPWPRRTAAAVCAFAEENHRQGSLNYPRWLETEAALRRKAGELLHANPADIALLKNTSEGLSVVAHGLPWSPGDNIVSTDEEFPSNRIVWESLSTEGVELRRAALNTGDPEGALFALVDERTRVIAVSSVQYASGLRMDLERIGAFCRARDIVFCVDAIQSIGALRIDVQAIGADAVVADGHKWMLAPEGIALFYTRPALRERLRLRQYGWHMVEEHGDFERREWAIARDARRFECGSPNMLGIHGLLASLELLAEVGMSEVERRVLANAGRLRELIAASGVLETLGPVDADRRSGIVVFRRPGHDPLALHRALMEHGVLCAPRGGGVRFSPHFHTRDGHLERAVELACRL